MVVGPQQHWLHINQHHFRAWTHLGLESSPKKRVSGASRNVSFSTPQRSPLGSIENTSAHETPLPAPTPGQPRKARDRMESTHEHKEPVVSVVTETTSDGTKVIVNVSTPEHHDKDGSKGKRAASYASLGKSPSGGGRRVMSRNAENISPYVKSEVVRTASGKRVTSNSGGVREGRVRKASGSKQRIASGQR